MQELVCLNSVILLRYLGAPFEISFQSTLFLLCCFEEELVCYPEFGSCAFPLLNLGSLVLSCIDKDGFHLSLFVWSGSLRSVQSFVWSALITNASMMMNHLNELISFLSLSAMSRAITQEELKDLIIRHSALDSKTFKLSRINKEYRSIRGSDEDPKFFDSITRVNGNEKTSVARSLDSYRNSIQIRGEKRYNRGKLIAYKPLQAEDSLHHFIVKRLKYLHTESIPPLSTELIQSQFHPLGKLSCIYFLFDIW